MRDPNRIKPYLQIIEQIWEKYPDLRFSQLVLNVFTQNSDYYKEDEETYQMFKNLYQI